MRGSGEETQFWRQNCLLRLAKSLEPVPGGAMLCFVMVDGGEGAAMDGLKG